MTDAKLPRVGRTQVLKSEMTLEKLWTMYDTKPGINARLFDNSDRQGCEKTNLPANFPKHLLIMVTFKPLNGMPSRQAPRAEEDILSGGTLQLADYKQMVWQ